MRNIKFQSKMGSTPETMGQVLLQRCHLILLFLTTKSLQKNMLCVVYSQKVRSDGVLMNFFVICISVATLQQKQYVKTISI